MRNCLSVSARSAMLMSTFSIGSQELHTSEMLLNSIREISGHTKRHEMAHVWKCTAVPQHCLSTTVVSFTGHYLVYIISLTFFSVLCDRQMLIN